MKNAICVVVLAALLHVALAPTVTAQPAGEVRRLREANRRVETTPALVWTGDQTAPAPARMIEAARPGDLLLVQATTADESFLSRFVTSQALEAVGPGGEGPSAVALPGVFRQVAADNEEVQLKPYVLISQNLRRDRTTGEFVGAIKVGVGELAFSRSSRQLTAPITFQVLEHDVATPSLVVIDRTTPPYDLDIEIRVASASQRVLHIASPFDPAGFRIELPLDPAVDLSVDSEEIEGFGLEVVDVNVSVLGVDNPAGQRVTLSARPAAYFAESTLTLDEHGHASTTLRSRDVALTTIQADVAGLESGSTDIRFRFPYATIGASLLGGLIGGGVRLLSGARRSPRRTIALLLAALGSGVLVFALYAIGVNVLSIAPSVAVGSVLVLAVSGLGAYFGPAALPALGGANRN